MGDDRHDIALLRGSERADEATFVILRKRMGSCLIGLRAARMVRNVGLRAGYVECALVASEECCMIGATA